MREYADLNIVIVAMGTPEEALAYKASHKSPQRYICDPDQDLYEEFGLQDARITQVFNLHTMARGARATLGGHRQGRPGKNPLRLGGTFVIDRSGALTWSHVSQDVADYPTPEQIKAALLSAGKEA